MRSVFFLILFINVVRAQINLAQSADSVASSLPIYNAEPVVINTTRDEQSLLRVPYSVQYFSQEEIQNGQKQTSLEETLQSVPGVAINNRNNFALGERISFRGIGARASFGVRGIKIIVDEIPLTMPDGQSQLNNLDLGSAGTIEIIRGPTASLYGNASGGLINIRTEDIPNKKLQIVPGFLFGSYGYTNLNGKIIGVYNKSHFLININRFKSDGFRENSAAEHWSINAINRYNYSNTVKLTTLVNYFYSPYALNPSSLPKDDAETNPTSSRYFVKQQGAGERISQGQAGLTLSYKPDTTQQLKITLYGILRGLTNPIPSRIIKLKRTAGGIRSAYTTQSVFNKITVNWTLGIDAEIQYDLRSEFENNGIPVEEVGKIKPSKTFGAIEYGKKAQNQEESVLGIGPFIRVEIPLMSHLLLTLGARYDYYNFTVMDKFLADSSDNSGKINMQQFNPMTGLVFAYKPTHSIYFNYSTAFQTPTTAELSNRADDQGGFNTGLKPESINNFELGLKGIFPAYNLFYQLSLYHMLFTDMLIPFQNGNSDEVYYRNAVSAKNIGIEFSIEWQLSNPFSIQFSYSYMDFIFDDYQIANSSADNVAKINFANNYIPGVSPQKLFAALRFENASGLLTIIQAKWSDKYYTNDFNGPPPGSELPSRSYINEAYITLDLRVAKTWNFSNFNIDLFGGIDNLLDASYNGSVVPNAGGANFFEPAAGRTWYSGIKVTL